ncbi:MAG: FKBP-type peptidyl-prolyl cis-trans isomerase [Chitinophagaceae bacterium]|nr:FKBP-type peptidyl-prolyl cis-trans isomerase [Chitinophagaceae bacterium]MBP6477346.1 FKBP-type peptidyl-prolyl cis-trans isomerase [Chitinophagaceae bacterium]MBP7107546.1 FKBP-type peptidyl-prolyl cis-trans isomerase [Chitinophagaceae bacterium]MBP7315131.1 FKBP-type peptidyl-prolyl cis-trans isomerase [Chitinophagaceae bacterium]HQV55054.1 FKBP-type peptidyl-prolyl cis-trans isomerase [Chitinophagaceae bacterium]
MRIKNFLFVLIAVATLASCGKTTYRKTPGGMPYKVYSGSDTQRIAVGNIIKVHFTRTIKDSVDYTTTGSLPVYVPISANSTPYDLSEIWTKLKKGDSVVATQMMDTFIMRNPQHPNFLSGQFKKGDKIVISLKIIDVFASDSLAQLDEAKQKKEWESKEGEIVAKYIKDKNITAQKTTSGVYVETLTPGTGNVVGTGKYVSVNYTGTTFGGFKFDSNTDSAFQHVAPLSFTTASGEMTKGFDDGVQMMRKGEQARVYVPSSLAYGAQPNPQSGIKPYENLIFDIVVLDIKDKAPPPPPAPVQAPQQMPQQ